MIAPIIFHSHVTELWFWISIATIDTINNHSGYKIFPASGASFHDYHHESFKYNFGVLGYLDMLHGTYRVRSVARDW